MGKALASRAWFSMSACWKSSKSRLVKFVGLVPCCQYHNSCSASSTVRFAMAPAFGPNDFKKPAPLAAEVSLYFFAALVAHAFAAIQELPKVGQAHAQVGRHLGAERFLKRPPGQLERKITPALFV